MITNAYQDQNMELRHLRYFVAVAEELHFGRAAIRLRVSQPALSQQVKALEGDLGVELLVRTKRHVVLTDAGRAFLDEARRALAAAETATRVARRAARGDLGRLRVGYVDLAMWEVLPAILRAFCERHPEVDLTLTELHREPQRRALERGDLDVGCFTLREGDGAFTGQLVASDPLVAALPSGHPLARRPRVRLAALQRDPWVIFPRELRTQYTELVYATCAAAGFVPHVAQEASQLHTLSALVSAGVGVSLLPRAVARAARAGVAFRPLAGQEAAPRLALHLVWRTDDLSPAGAQFVSAARTVITAGRETVIA
jgi:DNA-binding transcriptional LysR family regulator